MGSNGRAAALVEQLRTAADAFIAFIDQIPADRWSRVDVPDVWSPAKDAEHVAEGNALHQWVVRAALRQQPEQRPVLDRARMTAQAAQREVVALLRERTRESIRLIGALTDEQLRLPCRPPRTVEEFVKRVLIGHYGTHHAEIERKLRRS
jgi:DinB superfamily